MKIGVFCMLLLLLNTPLYSQIEGKALIDSVKKELAHKHDDTTIVILMCTLSFGYFDIQPDSGVYWGKMALDAASKIRWEKGIGRAQNNIGVNFLLKSQYDSAKTYLNGALRVDRKIGDLKNTAIVLNNIASVYAGKGDIRAINYYFEALQISNRLNDNKNAAITYGNIGLFLDDRGNYTTALQYYYKALKIEQENGYRHYQAIVLGNIGNIYVYQHDYDKAIEYYGRALDIFQKLGEVKKQAWIINHLGEAFTEKNDIAQAMPSYKNALELYHRCGSDSTEDAARVYKNIGYLKLKEKKYDSSLANYVLAKHMEEAIGYKSGIIDILKEFGNFYIELATYAETSANREQSGISNPLRKKYLKRALLYFDSSLRLNNAGKYLKTEIDCYKSMANTYQLLGDYRKSTEYLRKYNQLKDSVFSVDLIKILAISDVQRKYEAQMITDSLKSAERSRVAKIKIKEQNNIIVFGGLCILLLLLFSVVAGYNYNRRKTLAFENKMFETEMAALRSQMNPHFVFNALNSIYAFIQENSNKAAGNYLVKFSKLVRIILELSLKSNSTISDEIETMKLYLELEQIRLENKFAFTIELDDGIDPENVLMPSLILQPFIENAVIHGVSVLDHSGRITIKISIAGQMLHCSITDNGPGFNYEKIFTTDSNRGKKHSRGVQITRERILILNKVMGTDAGFMFSENHNGGTKVDFTFPLKYKF